MQIGGVGRIDGMWGVRQTTHKAAADCLNKLSGIAPFHYMARTERQVTIKAQNQSYSQLNKHATLEANVKHASLSTESPQH